MKKECMNVFEIEFPIVSPELKKNQVQVKDKSVNALYYLYQDKYSFWYRFVVNEGMDINFTVSPTNTKDKYQPVVFKYSGTDFCDKLVNSDIEPLAMERSVIFLPGDQLVYKYSIKAAAGDIYQVAILSIHEEDCGHFLKIEAANEALAINAIHRPCYNFEALTVPDFSLARQIAPNVKLYLEQYTPKTTPEPLPEPPTEGYGSIETIEVQKSADDDLVSVGDKLVLNNVFFYNNTYAFKPDATEELEQLTQFLNDNPSVNIEIQGHTANSSQEIKPDPTFRKQGPEWNFKGSALKLSEMRALAVRDYLLSKGIDRKRLTYKGYGDSQKRVPEANTFEESEKNMRVEILVVE